MFSLASQGDASNAMGDCGYGAPFSNGPVRYTIYGDEAVLTGNTLP